MLRQDSGSNSPCDRPLALSWQCTGKKIEMHNRHSDSPHYIRRRPPPNTVTLSLTQKYGVHDVNGVQDVVRKLIWLVRRHHKTQSMTMEVVHSGFGGAMVRFQKAGGEAEKWRSSMKKRSTKTLALFPLPFLSSLSLSLLPHDLIKCFLVVQIPHNLRME